MSSKFEKLVAAAEAYAPASCRADKAASTRWLRENQDAVLQRLFVKENQRISRRVKIIAFACAAQLGVRETNKLLRSYGAESLYARNLPDITIIRGLELHYSAEELCKLMAKVQPLSLSLQNDANKFFLRDGRFSCSIQSMEAYFDAARVPAPDEPDEKMTREMTSELQEEFDAVLEESDETFLTMLKENISMFSAIRERTRREFLRHLYNWSRFVIQHGNESEIEKFFMNVSPKTRPEEWKINFTQLVTYVDEEMYMQFLLDPQQTFENPLYEIQKCAKLLRNFILGETDISRTLFTSILLFFMMRSTGDGVLDLLQINAVLDKCGFKLVDVGGDDALDRLVLDIIDNQHLPKQEFQDVLLFDLDDPDELLFLNYEGEDYTRSRSTAAASALTR